MNWETYRKKLLKNKEYLKVIEKLEPEYQRARRRIIARIKRVNKIANVANEGAGL